jgi:hypothetical protein
MGTGIGIGGSVPWLLVASARKTVAHTVSLSPSRLNLNLLKTEVAVTVPRARKLPTPRLGLTKLRGTHPPADGGLSGHSYH